MKLTDLGERELIKKLASFIEIGDDAACIKHGDEYLVLTTDLVYGKTHILPGMSWKQIGKLVVSVNLSDIAAMGARPVAFLLSYGSPDMELDEFDELIHSVNEQCKKYGLRFAGGDTNQTEELILSGFCVGTTDKPVLRSTAKVGDILAVTGSLGDAALGTEILLKNLKHQGRDVINKALEPEPRINEGILLNNHATAMTDISDSLAVSIYDLAEMSNVGINVFPDKIPVTNSAMNSAEKLDLNLIDYVLYGGGDYELLFTIPKEGFEEIKDRVNATKIGDVTAGGITAIRDREEYKIDKKGYEHFIKRI
ncbi:MAG: thiamine-phosphate kinase [Candidatus Altiarchaeota archaeon]|nr:thiamine-phosphate kinase [Candidatus Altiarchaeota archaeon]